MVSKEDRSKSREYLIRNYDPEATPQMKHKDQEDLTSFIYTNQQNEVIQ